MIPDYKSLMRPLLWFLSDGHNHKDSDLMERLAGEFKMTHEERMEFLTDNKGIKDFRFRWAVKHLKDAGLIDIINKHTFSINELGRLSLIKTPDNFAEDNPIVVEHPQNLRPVIENNVIPRNMIKNITRPASLVRQGDLTIYATSLKVRDLLIPNFYSIERLDPENASERGYQRLLNKARAKKLADYIVEGLETRDAFLPTSIFIATEKNIAFNPSNNTIEIDIDKVAPFNVVDGQHRVEGLKMATEKDPRVLDFEVPVNIAVNLSEIAQMCHFLIVNTTQKSVEEGVAQRIRARLTQALGVLEMPNLPRWILNSVQRGEDEMALQFVDFLNSEYDSPWYHRVRMANEENGEGSITQKSFVKSIKKYVLVANNPIIQTETVDKQLRIFLNYWKAITNIIGTEEPTVLFKYNGVELFCRYCVPFFNRMINMSDFKVTTMQTLLEEVFENVEGDAVGVGHTDFWIKGSTASGLNSGALSKINTEMVKALHKSSEHRYGREMEV